MAQTGSWGDIAFSVAADSEWFTFRDLSRTTKARVATHEVLDEMQRQQVTGRDLDEVAMTVQLDGRYCDVARTIERIRERVGEHDLLMLGGVNFKDHTLESVTENWRRTDCRGRPLTAELQLAFREYR